MSGGSKQSGIGLLRQLVDRVEEPMLVADARQRDQPLCHVNAGFLRLTGYRSEDILGYNCRFLQRHDIDQPGIKLIRRAVAAGKAAHALIRNYRQDDAVFINELQILPVGGDPGRPDWFVGLQRRISDISFHGRDPIGAEEKAGGRAHAARPRSWPEIITLLESLGQARFNPVQRQGLEAAMASARLLIRDDNQLSFAAVESGAREPLNVSELLAATVAQAAPDLPDGYLQVDANQLGSRVVRGHRDSMIAVLQRLAELHAAFAGSAGAVLTVQDVPLHGGSRLPQFSIHSVSGKSSVLTPETRPAAAAERSRLLSPEATFPELSRLALASGGDVWADVDFSFHFRMGTPLSANRLAEAPPAAVTKPDGRTLRVLVAEDNPINAQVVSAFLERNGHRATVAEDGLAVEQLLATGDFDLLLLDVHMPHKDGIEVAADLRRDPRYRDLPIIAVTAAPTAESRERCVRAGMDGYLAKPVKREELDEVLLRLAPRLPTETSADRDAEPLTGTPPIDLAAALRAVDSDIALLRAMCRAFLRDLPNRWTALERALACSDWETVHFQAHTLKGGLASFCAHGAVGKAEDICQLAKGRQPSMDRLRGVADELEREINAVVVYVTDELLDAAASELIGRGNHGGVGGARVLVVEDSATTAVMITEFLRQQGYHVQESRSGEEGLRVARRFRPDIILMDCLMPGIDGLEACRRLRRDPVTEDVPVLIITALNDEQAAQEAIDAGASDFITKPIFMPVLRQRLRQMELSRERHQQVRYLAYHDSLTGLPNRTSFHNRLDRMLASCRDADAEHVLMYLDLDQFKVVNDTRGHQAGDELLVQLGRILAQQVRDEDLLARLGGDEFGVLLERCQLEDGLRVADSLIEAVRDFAFFWEDQTFLLGVSIGVVSVTRKWVTAAELLSAADTACYAAKAAGRDRYQVYSENDGFIRRQAAEIHLVPEISHALENDRFVLYRQRIQPIDSHRTEPAHYEVLVRMLSADGEHLSPGGFIPAAERYQLMGRLDRWVIRHSFQFIAEQEGALSSRYSINLSGGSLVDEDLAGFVETQLRNFAIDPARVCFEITETATIRNMERAVEFVNTVRSLGCRFALDDFGAGLASFAYLKALPVDFLKIDGGFVKDLLEDRFDAAMVQAIQQVGETMGIRTIAEFVENDAILERLRQIGVNYAQGFGIHRPEPCLRSIRTDDPASA